MGIITEFKKDNENDSHKNNKFFIKFSTNLLAMENFSLKSLLPETQITYFQVIFLK